MRFFAFLYLFGSPCDRRILVEAGPAYTRPATEDCTLVTCHDVHEVFQRPNGARYVKESTDCTDEVRLASACLP